MPKILEFKRDKSIAIHQSDLGKYLTCPFMFYLSHVLHRPEEWRHPAAVLGTAGHMTINQLIEDRIDRPSFFVVNKMLLQNLTLCETGKDPQSVSRYGGNVPPIKWEFITVPRGTYFTNYSEGVFHLFQDQRFYDFVPFLYEVDFTVEIAGQLFQGTIDSAAKFKCTEDWLNDYKFTRQRPAQSVIDRNFQLGIYAKAMKDGVFHWIGDDDQIHSHEFKRVPDHISIIFMRDFVPLKQKAGPKMKGEFRGPGFYITSRTPQQLNFMETEIALLLEQIDAGIFPMRPNDIGSCRGFCRYNDACMNAIEGLDLSYNRQSMELPDMPETELDNGE